MYKSLYLKTRILRYIYFLLHNKSKFTFDLQVLNLTNIR